MTACPRCGRENESDVRFCGRCGLDFVEYNKNQARPSTDETKFCYKHPKEATNLSCGRCEKPLCTKCAIIGPAGPRCKECAKHNVAVRPAAVLHGAKSNVKSLARLGPWGLYAVVISIGALISIMRSCSAPAPESRPTAQTESPQSSED